MKLQVFTVLDTAVGAYLQPFFCRANGEAIRSFTDAVNDPKHQFSQHMMDYVLFYCGEYDDEGGVFTTSAPVRVISATEVAVHNVPQPIAKV